MSFSVKDTNGKEVGVSMLYPVIRNDKEIPTVTLGTGTGAERNFIKLPLHQFGEIIVYVLSDWRSVLPPEIKDILLGLRQLFTVEPVQEGPFKRRGGV